MKYEIWLVNWLKNYVQPSSKKRTYVRYSEIVYQHIIPKLGETELNELTPFEIQCFITELLRSGNLKNGRGLAPNSVNGIINVIQSSLNIAYSLGYMSNFISDKIKRPRVSEKKIECFSSAEQKKIEKYIINSNKPKFFGIILCLYTGLRIGELLALEWSDIDFVKRELNVNKSCHDGKKENGTFSRIIEIPKTQSSIRIIPLPKQIMPWFREIKRKSQSIYVISNGKEPVSIRSYQRSFSGILKKLEIQHHAFHSLRHTFATRALECGIDVKTLSEILGHKSPNVTLNRYVHSLVKHKKEMMDKLGIYYKNDTY